MLDEFKSVAEIYEKLGRQLDFVNDYLNDDVEKFLTESYKLETKFSVPYILYLTRQYDGVYNKERSYLVNLMESKINEYFKSNVSDKLEVKFFDIKGLLFSVYLDKLELVRFSIINKNYAYMYKVLNNKDELNKQIEISNNNIYHINEQIIAHELSKIQYQEFADNYFKLFAHIKRLSDIFNLMFNSKKLTKNIKNHIRIQNESITSLEEQKHREYSNQKYYLESYEKTKDFASMIDDVFTKLEYKIDDRSKFYI